jgi:hypothetical protein
MTNKEFEVVPISVLEFNLNKKAKAQAGNERFLNSGGYPFNKVTKTKLLNKQIVIAKEEFEIRTSSYSKSPKISQNEIRMNLNINTDL